MDGPNGSRSQAARRAQIVSKVSLIHGHSNYLSSILMTILFPLFLRTVRFLFQVIGLPRETTSKASEESKRPPSNFLVRPTLSRTPTYPSGCFILISLSLLAHIADTGIATQRDAVKEKEKEQSLKQKTRERVQPKMGKIDIDYQKLHDAFFRFATKPKMTDFGEMYVFPFFTYPSTRRSTIPLLPQLLRRQRARGGFERKTTG